MVYYLKDTLIQSIVFFVLFFLSAPKRENCSCSDLEHSYITLHYIHNTIYIWHLKKYLLCQPNIYVCSAEISFLSVISSHKLFPQRLSYFVLGKVSYPERA